MVLDRARTATGSQHRGAHTSQHREQKTLVVFLELQTVEQHVPRLAPDDTSQTEALQFAGIDELLPVLRRVQPTGSRRKVGQSHQRQHLLQACTVGTGFAVHILVAEHLPQGHGRQHEQRGVQVHHLVGAGDSDLAATGNPNAENGVDDRRLAGAFGAGNVDAATGRHDQIEIEDHRLHHIRCHDRRLIEGDLIAVDVLDMLSRRQSVDLTLLDGFTEASEPVDDRHVVGDAAELPDQDRRPTKDPSEGNRRLRDLSPLDRVAEVERRHQRCRDERHERVVRVGEELQFDVQPHDGKKRVDYILQLALRLREHQRLGSVKRDHERLAASFSGSEAQVTFRLHLQEVERRHAATDQKHRHTTEHRIAVDRTGENR